MKRNNYFMIAYMLFIGVCIIARVFVEFESWGRLVAAVTCSSWFFLIYHQKSLPKYYSSSFETSSIASSTSSDNSASSAICANRISLI